MRKPALPIELPPEETEKFWRLVIKGEGCWEWAGRHDAAGYCGFSSKGVSYKAHRVAYVLTFGNPDPLLVLDHLCRNRGCCNPAHLEVVTQTENILRGESMTAKARRNTHCKFGHEYTPETVEYDKNGARKCLVCGPTPMRRSGAKYRDTEKGRLAQERKLEARRAASRERFMQMFPGIPYSPEAVKREWARLNGRKNVGDQK